MQEIDGKKEQILTTARSLFARLGYAGVGIRKIAEDSNCNLSAISYYFGGKENLYAECFSYSLKKDVTEFTDLLAGPNDKENFAVKLRSFCMAFAHHVVHHSELMQLLVSEMNAQVLGTRNLHKQIFTPITEPLVKFLEEGKASGILKSNFSIPMTVRMLLLGVVVEVVFLKESNSIDVIVDELVTVCTGSIYA